MRAQAVILLVLGVGACSKFDAKRDHTAVAECYSAFSSLTISSKDPALGQSLEDQYVQQLVHKAGVERLAPFMERAQKQAGGERAFMRIAAAWRIQPDYDLAIQPTPHGKQEAYQRILRKASDCHGLMTYWGASKKEGVIGRQGG